MKNIKFVLKIVWKVSKKWFIWNGFMRLFSGLIPVINVLLIERIVENLIIYANSNNNFRKLIILLLIQLFIQSIKPLLENILNLINFKTEKKLDFILEKQIAEKSAKSPYYYFDNPDFYNHLERLKFNKGQKLLNPLRAIASSIQNTITLTTLIIYLSRIHWSIAAASVLIFFPVYFFERKYGLMQFILSKSQSSDSRMLNYITILLTSRESAGEIKLFNSKKFLLKKWSVIFNKIKKEELNLITKKEFSNSLTALLTASVYFISSIIVIRLIRLSSDLNIGAFVGTMQSFQEAQLNFKNLSRNLTMINKESLYISDLQNFLEFDVEKLQLERSETFPILKKEGIKIRNLSFTYPFSRNKVLKNISLDIKPKEKVAIVGENGSGKTTLINCLLGFYPIEEGEVTIEKLPINRIELNSIYKNTTAIFQNYVHYNFTIKENITFKDDLTNAEINLMKRVTKNTGASYFIDKFDNNYDTILGRRFANSEDLSGGQWQKLAISRALFKGGQIFVLDEPSSSLDPKSELNLFEIFNELSKDKTTIYISHRMASARIADKIVVMKDGEIVEIGNHNTLIKIDGEYSKLYNAQAKWYQDKSFIVEV